MPDYGMRGEAAQRLMKGKKGQPPPEDDLGIPPEEEGAPSPDGGGAPPMDLASILGAAGGGGGGAPPSESPQEEAQEPPPQPMDLDSALGGVESALESLPPEAAEEIRVHLNAIREIAAKAGSSAPQGGAPMPQDAGGGAPSPVGASPSEKEIAG